MPEYSKEQIRAAVRDALRESLPVPQQQEISSLDSEFARKLRRAMTRSHSPVEVAIGSSRELNEFVKELSMCMEDDKIKLACRRGQLRFELRNKATAPKRSSRPNHTSANSEISCSDYFMDSGVLTESAVLKLAKQHQQIVLGPKVVLTPLAKDRARSVNIKF